MLVLVVLVATHTLVAETAQLAQMAEVMATQELRQVEVAVEVVAVGKLFLKLTK
jgi:hypothetical protein